MTKWGFALPCNVVADGSVDRKSSRNLISHAPARLNLFNKIHGEKPFLPANLDKTASQPSPFHKLRAGSSGLIAIKLIAFHDLMGTEYVRVVKNGPLATA
jgi:hypothetical protein